MLDMPFIQTQGSLRGGYNYTQVQVKYDLNLILFNNILQKHSKQNK